MKDYISNNEALDLAASTVYKRLHTLSEANPTLIPVSSILLSKLFANRLSQVTLWNCEPCSSWGSICYSRMTIQLCWKILQDFRKLETMPQKLPTTTWIGMWSLRRLTPNGWKNIGKWCRNSRPEYLELFSCHVWDPFKFIIDHNMPHVLPWPWRYRQRSWSP